MAFRSVNEMDERIRFVVRATEPGANISELCRVFGISRQLGHKLLSRYEEQGFEGIAPRSRRPKESPFETSAEMICEIVKLRSKYYHWGGEKLRELLLREHTEQEVPSIRTIERIIKRSGLVTERRRRRIHRELYEPRKLTDPKVSNHVWTVDFKGWWKTLDGTVIYPLTIRDAFSRYILDVTALTHADGASVKERFIECFEKYGMPRYIRSDNGSPFASVRAVRGLSTLSAWWIKNGVIPERIVPGNPQMNGAHERMHSDMKKELQVRPGVSIKDQQKYFDDWREEFNTIRPHKALSNKTPNVIYRSSKRIYDRSEPEYEYPKNYETRRVSRGGRFYWRGKEKFISSALDGEPIGIRWDANTMLSVWFCNFLIGYTDDRFENAIETKRSQSL